MSDKTAEKPKPREDGSYERPAWKGRWWHVGVTSYGTEFPHERSDGTPLTYTGRSGWEVGQRNAKWYPVPPIPGLDEPRPEGERPTKEQAEKDPWDNECAVVLVHDALDRHGVVKEPSRTHRTRYISRIDLLASERDAALERAEKAERERDEKWKAGIREACKADICFDPGSDGTALCLDRFVEALREEARVWEKRYRNLDLCYVERQQELSRTANDLSLCQSKLTVAEAELSSLKSSASRPVLPEGVDERQLRAACERALRSPGAASIWSSEAKGILALLDAFSSPPPETETGEAEREGPKTLSREEFVTRCKAITRSACEAGFQAGLLVADCYRGEARP